MPRTRYAQTESRIARWIREGRGTGSGKSYRPWLTVSDVPSRGRTHRVFWATTCREHHLLSDNEYYAFLAHCWEDPLDIREQYPIIDRRESMEIAARLKVRHPIDPKTKTVSVITTDQLVSYGTPSGTILHAKAIKEEKDLENPRTLAKLEIERTYWSRRNVRWSLMVSSDLKTRFTRNLAWIFNSGPSLIHDEICRITDRFLEPQLAATVQRDDDQAIRQACLELDASLNVKPGASMACLRRLLATKRVHVNLDVPRIQDLPCRSFSFMTARHV